MALLLAVFIALVTVLIFLFLEPAPAAWLVAGLTAFSASFLVVYATLEWLVFREISRLINILTKIRKGELAEVSGEKAALAPMRKLSEEVAAFASLKQKEVDELIKLEKFRKEFVADVSHELKTPIFATQGFIHTLLDGAMKDKQVRKKFLKKAARSLDGLNMLVQDLLTLSQMESGDIKMKFDSFDLVALCTDVTEQLEDKARKKDIRLRIKDSKQPLVVYADALRIAQVVTNLVSNAVNYTPEGGEVTVSFEVEKNLVTTLVTDNGEGIPAEHVPRIFERFYRVEKSRSREKGGTGLGLAIVKHILEGHNTRASVQTTVGEGSVFSFKLPRAKNSQVN
jgi:two-component system phosphate regulon sensor histidine kinase PhoR